MHSRKALLIAAAAALGIGGTPVVQQQSFQHNRTVAIANGATQREIKADCFGGYLDGIARQFHQQAGMNPAEFGQTRSCQRMMRRSKLARAGIGRRRS